MNASLKTIALLSMTAALAACNSSPSLAPLQPFETSTPSVLPTSVAMTTAAPSGMPTSSVAPTMTPSGKPTTVATTSPAPTTAPTPVATIAPTAMPSQPAAPAQYLTGYYNETSGTNLITQVLTTMTVPAEPPASGTVFLWPGLDPVNGAHYNPINNGVLQPVLTWGPSCAPGTQPTTFSTWWVSGQYVNTIGDDSGYTGCQGGEIMSVAVGDTLMESMVLSGTTWTQTILDVQRGTTVSYAIDMMQQEQQVAYFVIEGYGQAPVGAVTFSNTSFTFASVPAEGCALTALETTSPLDTSSAPVASNGGLTCSISNITIYAPYSTVSSSAFRRGPAPYSGQVNGRR